MLNRLSRIHSKFGLKGSARTRLLLVGFVGLSLFGFFGFNSLWPTGITVIGLVVGWLLRRQIVEAAELLFWAMPVALFIYGVLLFVGERMGLSREMQLIIITLTTVVAFDTQFWALSDPSIVKTADD
jgi:hypothetical protein